MGTGIDTFAEYRRNQRRRIDGAGAALIDR
jgi:hypothetical protein